MFAVAVNFLIVARFVYPEWLAASLVRVACWVGVGVWIMLVVRAAGRLPALLYPRAVSEVPDAFPLAQQHFLRGDWAEAEAVLSGCLEVDPRDCQALLMLAATYRFTGRLDAALRTLDLLGRLETGDPWWLECAAQRRRLQALIDSTPADVEGDDAGGEPAESTERPQPGGTVVQELGETEPVA
jgi:tetratricopeptide (TPR) repeat protein